MSKRRYFSEGALQGSGTEVSEGCTEADLARGLRVPIACMPIGYRQYMRCDTARAVRSSQPCGKPNDKPPKGRKGPNLEDVEVSMARFGSGVNHGSRKLQREPRSVESTPKSPADLLKRFVVLGLVNWPQDPLWDVFSCRAASEC